MTLIFLAGCLGFAGLLLFQAAWHARDANEAIRRVTRNHSKDGQD